jgi:hypothetical protein
MRERSAAGLDGAPGNIYLFGDDNDVMPYVTPVGPATADSTAAGSMHAQQQGPRLSS